MTSSGAAQNVNNQNFGDVTEVEDYIAGDVAYFSSSREQYTVIRNVFVKAEESGGDVQRDDTGRVILYGDGAVPAKGVVLAAKALVGGSLVAIPSDDNLTAANGYYDATIVVDGLADAAGGEGVDVLLGIEGLAFVQPMISTCMTSQCPLGGEMMVASVQI